MGSFVPSSSLRTRIERFFQEKTGWTDQQAKQIENAIYTLCSSSSLFPIPPIPYLETCYDIYGSIDSTTNRETIQLQIEKGLVRFHGPQFQDERMKDELEAKNIETPLDVKEGVNICSKCKSKKTYQFSLQTRSCDEPATIFLTCATCGHRWKIG